MSEIPVDENKGYNLYKELLESFSPEDLARICRVKRFFECSDGDPAFWARVKSDSVTDADRDRLKRIGVDFAVEEMAGVWREPEAITQIIRAVREGEYEDLPDEIKKKFDGYPLLQLWFRYKSQRAAMTHQVRSFVIRVPKNAKFDAWRLRRMAAARSELGSFANHIEHAPLAIELGDGCSVQCWFCAFSARKFTRNLSYPEQGEYFREIVRTCLDLFGRRATGMALLYYATEPHDNPHYVQFMKDFEEITRYPVCTSTAVVDDPEWIRSLIAFYREGPDPWPRLSVLTVSKLHKIHDLYSPDELRDVECLMQMKGYRQEKVHGGRILKEHAGLRDRDPEHLLDEKVPQGTISCMTGFMVNLVNGTLQLQSPCHSCERWPLGYRVFDEARFEGVEGFREAVLAMIDRNMFDTPASTWSARFRDDLVYRTTDAGFNLLAPNQIHHFEANEVYRAIAQHIADGNMTYGQILEDVGGDDMANIMMTLGVIQELYDNGFLDEALIHAPVARN